MTIKRFLRSDITVGCHPNPKSIEIIDDLFRRISFVSIVLHQKPLVKLVSSPRRTENPKKTWFEVAEHVTPTPFVQTLSAHFVQQGFQTVPGKRIEIDQPMALARYPHPHQSAQ